MTWSIGEELRRSFHLAALRHEMSALQSPHQRTAARVIMDRCEEVRQRESEAYNKKYLTRVELAQRRLIDQAGSKTDDFVPRWARRDRFNPADTLRQAEREVRHVHEQRIARIDAIETSWLEDLAQRSMRENLMRGKAREDFHHATDRRSRGDRRTPIRTGPSR